MYQMKGILTIKETLQIMHLDKPFSVTVCTFDRARKTGGERRKFADATILHSGQLNPNPQGVQLRDPNHKSNSTLNIRTKSGDTIAIHIPLIENLNGQRVSL